MTFCMNRSLRRIRRFKVGAILSGLFIYNALSAFGAYAEPDSKRLRAVCQEINTAARRLPRTTALEDWPDLISIPGMSHPNWKEESPKEKLDLIKIVAAYDVNEMRDPTAAPSEGDISAAWNKIGSQWLPQIEKGDFKVQGTSLVMPGAQILSTKVKLYRIGIPEKSFGTFGDPLYKYTGAEWKKRWQQEPIRLHWKYIIASADKIPALRNQPLNIYNFDQDVVIIDGAVYFINVIPPAFITRYAADRNTAMQAGTQACEFKF